MNDKVVSAEQILKDLYISGKNYYMTKDIVYNYLRNLGIGNPPKNIVNNSFFNRWISRFSKKKNIDVFVSPDWKYFCQFTNGNREYDCIKMYVPLKSTHIYEGANRIFDFLAKNNIAHESKISSDVRTDDVVIRLFKAGDAQKLQKFIDKDKYIREGMLKVNPFCFNNNGVGYAFDGYLSYNSVLSTTIAKYINERILMGASLEQINIADFSSYINECLMDKRYLDSLRNYKHYERRDPELVLGLIKLSLSSNNIMDYYNYYSNNCLRKHAVSQKEPFATDDKTELFHEFILTTVKKYPKGFDEKHKEISGIDYLNSYFKGYTTAVTRDNGLRDRVTKNLSVDDINQIVFNSGIVGNTIEIKRRKYIKMVLLNELIRCSIVKYGPNGFWQVQSYIDEGKKSYITYSVDKARIITETLSPQEIKKLLSDLNVNNISEYMQYYYSNTKKR